MADPEEKGHSPLKMPHEPSGCCSRWGDWVENKRGDFPLPATPCCELCEIVRHALPDAHSAHISVYKGRCYIRTTCSDPQGERKQERWTLTTKGKVFTKCPGQC